MAAGEYVSVHSQKDTEAAQFCFAICDADRLRIALQRIMHGAGLVPGILVRPASVGGLALMLAMLFSSDYSGAHAPLWQFFGASLSHSILALCFAAFLIGRADEVWSLPTWRVRAKKARHIGFREYA